MEDVWQTQDVTSM